LQSGEPVSDRLCVGKHLEPDAPPPPPPHKSYKVIVALAAIVLLAIVSMAVVAALNPVGGVAQAGDTATTPSLPVVPGGGESGPPTTMQTPPAPTTTGAMTTPSHPASSPPGTRKGGISGTYTTSENWTDRFEGVIAMVNTTDTAQAWKVVLKLPPDDKAYVTNWVEGGPMAVESRAGQTVTFEGIATIPPHSPAIVFHFQFDKVPNSATFAPVSCTVNGVACTVVKPT
jgi:hypothetical protein